MDSSGQEVITEESYHQDQYQALARLPLHLVLQITSHIHTSAGACSMGGAHLQRYPLSLYQH